VLTREAGEAGCFHERTLGPLGMRGGRVQLGRLRRHCVGEGGVTVGRREMSVRARGSERGGELDAVLLAGCKNGSGRRVVGKAKLAGAGGFVSWQRKSRWGRVSEAAEQSAVGLVGWVACRQ
jgi:hypothetical protein